MGLRRRCITMIGKNAIEAQRKRLVHARRNAFRKTIENRRGQTGMDSVAGEQVSAKKRAQSPAIESAVPFGMPGKMNHRETAPNGKFHAVIQPLIDAKRTIPKQPAARRFHGSANFCHSAITITSLIMLPVQSRGCNPRSRAFYQGCHIENMIEMAMGHQNAANRQILPATPRQRAVQGGPTAQKTGIDQIKSVQGPQDIKTHRESPDPQDILSHIAP